MSLCGRPYWSQTTRNCQAWTDKDTWVKRGENVFIHIRNMVKFARSDCFETITVRRSDLGHVEDNWNVLWNVPLISNTLFPYISPICPLARVLLYLSSSVLFSTLFALVLLFFFFFVPLSWPGVWVCSSWLSSLSLRAICPPKDRLRRHGNRPATMLEKHHYAPHKKRYPALSRAVCSHGLAAPSSPYVIM